MIKTDVFINDINNSNCYVIQDQENRKCIVIDPGSRNIDKILGFIQKENLKIEYIILTHSHFDHIAGVSQLVIKSKSKVISSRLCSEKISDPVKNLSYFADFGLIVSHNADIYIEELKNNQLEWNEHKLLFYNTPGHTNCSICIQLQNLLFTGDTLLKGIKSKVMHPDGNREQLKKTLNFIYESVPGSVLVYPGHGDSFILDTQDISVSLNK